MASENSQGGASRSPMLDIISNTEPSDDVISKLTESSPYSAISGLTRNNISLEQYQILIEMLMKEVSELGKYENGGKVVDRGSYSIIDPDKKLYKFLLGYHEKVKSAELEQARNESKQGVVRGQLASFTRKFITDSPRTYSRNPQLGKSSHYKNCPRQYGIDFRGRSGKLKPILPDASGGAPKTHLLFGDISPAFLVGQSSVTFLKMETIGIGTADEKIRHGLDYLKTRKSVEKTRDFLENRYKNVSDGINSALRNFSSNKSWPGRKNPAKNVENASRKEGAIDKEIIEKYNEIIKKFYEPLYRDGDKKTIDRMNLIVRNSKKDIKGMLYSLQIFENILESKQKKDKSFDQKIDDFKTLCKNKGYDLSTIAYRHGNEIILDLRKSETKKSEQEIESSISARMKYVQEYWQKLRTPSQAQVGLIKSMVTKRPLSYAFSSKDLSRRTGLVYNQMRMKDDKGKDMIVEIREVLGYGGFGTAYEAVVLSGDYKGQVFALKQQRLASLSFNNFKQRAKQVLKRPFMEAPNEKMEKEILIALGMFYGEAYIDYKKGTVATEENESPDPRNHQWGREQTKSRYYVLQPFMDGGDFSKLYKKYEGRDPSKHPPIEDTIPLMKSAISSLLDLHKSGYAHNDMHHENIMTKKRKNAEGGNPGSPPVAYVMDFGRATQEFDPKKVKDPEFTANQVADIKMMLNGKSGKPGSLVLFFKKMNESISKSPDLTPAEKSGAKDIIENIENRLKQISDKNNIKKHQDYINDQFSELEKILIKKPDVTLSTSKPKNR